MEVGDRVKFPFGKGEMEGNIKKIFQKTVYIVADFPRQKGKIIKRSTADLEKERKKPSRKAKTKSKKSE